MQNLESPHTGSTATYFSYGLDYSHSKDTFPALSPPWLTHASHHSLTLGWEPAECEAGDETCGSLFDLLRPLYILQMRRPKLGWVTVYVGYGTEFKVTDLVPGCSFTFRVGFERASEMSGKAHSSWSEEGTFNTDEEPIACSELHRAIQYGNTETVKNIVAQRPSSLLMNNRLGQSPLVMAAQKGSVEITTILLDAGSDVAQECEGSGKTALMTAIGLGHVEVAKLLVQKGADIEAADRNQCRPIHYAVDGNHVEALRYLLDAGVDKEPKDSSAWTPLMRAVIVNGNIDIIKELLTRGADPSVTDQNRRTLLMLAVLSDREDVIRLLVEAGADVTPRTEFNKTAYDMAVSKGLKAVFSILNPKGKEAAGGSGKEKGTAEEVQEEEKS